MYTADRIFFPTKSCYLWVYLKEKRESRECILRQKNSFYPTRVTILTSSKSAPLLLTLHAYTRTFVAFCLSHLSPARLSVCAATFSLHKQNRYNSRWRRGDANAAEAEADHHCYCCEKGAGDDRHHSCADAPTPHASDSLRGGTTRR